MNLNAQSTPSHVPNLLYPLARIPRICPRTDLESAHDAGYQNHVDRHGDFPTRRWDRNVAALWSARILILSSRIHLNHG